MLTLAVFFVSCDTLSFNNPNDPESSAYKWKQTASPIIAPVPLAQVVSTVAGSPGGGSFYGPLGVSISAEEGATIRYTLDGSEPTETSPVYAGPIMLESNATVRAKAWKPEYLSSPVAESAFTVYRLVRAWEWNTDGDAEGWVTSGYEKTYACTALDAIGGTLRVRFLKNVPDPSLWSQKINAGGHIDGAKISKIVFDMKHTTACPKAGLYVKTTKTESTSYIQIPLATTGEMTRYEVDATKWRAFDEITEIRLDALDWGSTVAGDEVLIDYLRIYAE
jgi:hypothetical protein